MALCISRSMPVDNISNLQDAEYIKGSINIEPEQLKISGEYRKLMES